MLSLCLYKSKKFTSTFILIFVSIFLSISNVAYAETMTSENFQLVNNAGQVTAQLTAGGDGTPGLFIYDNNRVPRITIGLYKDQVPTITINDAKGKATGIEQTLSKMEIATVQALQEQIRKQGIETAHAVQWASEVSKEINKLKEKEVQDAKTAEQLANESGRTSDCQLSDSELLFYQSLVKGTNPLAKP